MDNKLSFDTNTFAGRLNTIIEERGIRSHAELARLMYNGNPPENYSKLIGKYRHGETEPTAANIVLLCKALSCDADYLLGLSDDFEFRKSTNYIFSYTGLSAKAIQELHSETDDDMPNHPSDNQIFTDTNSYHATISILLSSEPGQKLLYLIGEYIREFCTDNKLFNNFTLDGSGNQRKYLYDTYLSSLIPHIIITLDQTRKDTRENWAKEIDDILNNNIDKLNESDLSSWYNLHKLYVNGEIGRSN